MTEIVIAVLGSGVLSAIISGLFGLMNNKREKLDKRFNKLEVDIIRTQLLLLLADYPQNTAEIMRVAEHYFHDLNGDWYMTSLFNSWLVENNVAKPEWFNEHD